MLTKSYILIQALALATLVVAGPAWPGAVPASIVPDRVPVMSAQTVRVLPERIYKVPDPGRAYTESWIASVIVGEPSQKLNPERLEVRFFSKGELLETQILEAAAVQVLPRNIWKLSAVTPAVSARRLFHIESSFDLHLLFSRPRSFETDEMQITVYATDDKQKVLALPPVKVPVEVYVQRTRLIFPWTGPGMMSQGWFNNGGHSGQSSWFAGDFLGLTPDTWGPQLRNEDENDAYAGFNRDVIAPAAGVIVAMRNDVPLNTKVNEEPPNESFMTLHDPIEALLGNYLVIDHGNGEFSAISHLNIGSISVRVGDRVVQGQQIGKVGNTGSSNGPHLHFELLDGPRPFVSNGLPYQFSNLNVGRLDRGTYFTTR